MPKLTVNLDEITKDYPLLVGGVGPTIAISEFSSDERDLFKEFIDYAVEQLDRVSPVLANDFKSQVGLIEIFAKIFKAKVDEKSFGGIIPAPTQFGAGLLIPYDFKYAPDVPSAYDGRTWKVTLTAGTPLYLVGSDTAFFKTSSTVNARSLILILKNGLIEVGSTPKLNQMKARTEKNDYPPFRLNLFADIAVEKEKPVYQYITPAAIPLWHDFGTKISVMPHTSGVSDLRILGVVFYEYDYYKELK